MEFANEILPNNESYNMGFNDGYLIGQRQENLPNYTNLTLYEIGFKNGYDKYVQELYTQ